MNDNNDDDDYDDDDSCKIRHWPRIHSLGALLVHLFWGFRTAHQTKKTKFKGSDFRTSHSFCNSLKLNI